MRARATTALSVLKAFSVGLPGGFTAKLDVDIAKGTADSGDPERDLATLIVEVGQVARAGGTGAIFFLDEMQALSEPARTWPALGSDWPSADPGGRVLLRRAMQGLAPGVGPDARPRVHPHRRLPVNTCPATRAAAAAGPRAGLLGGVGDRARRPCQLPAWAELPEPPVLTTGAGCQPVGVSWRGERPDREGLERPRAAA
jgi:hypothetical protein